MACHSQNADQVKFGVAGNPPNFFKSQFRKERGLSPAWLAQIGLDALEIQCTYGVRMPHKRAELFKEQSETHNIVLSIHAPYYVSISTSDTIVKQRTTNELKKCLQLADIIGSKRVIFHPGSAYKNRQESLENACNFMRDFGSTVDCGFVRFYPEIGGKIGQLGSLSEIIEICKSNTITIPCLDLAHHHARTNGSLMNEYDYERLFALVSSELGKESFNNMHIHMYPVSYTSKGESSHKAFSDIINLPEQKDFLDDRDSTAENYFPRYEHLLPVVKKLGLNPIIICEAKDSQDIGALEMKNYYNGLE
ncbi:MAG: TIM barrel protein [Bacilli bacterium]|nr:TIM barrel protein [Bacilli bacterium]